MLKDIPQLKVNDVALAVVPSQEYASITDAETSWKVFIINLKQELLTGVLVSSKGYGMVEGEQVKTSVLRHFYEEIPPQSYALIEPIDQSVFKLHNEYWVSFYINKTIYDKKFLFVPGSIAKQNYSKIPIINKSGIMIS
jgi:hypothetical protein